MPILLGAISLRLGAIRMLFSPGGPLFFMSSPIEDVFEMLRKTSDPRHRSMGMLELEWARAVNIEGVTEGFWGAIARFHSGQGPMINERRKTFREWALRGRSRE
jgi:hypothetical protein